LDWPCQSFAPHFTACLHFVICQRFELMRSLSFIDIFCCYSVWLCFLGIIYYYYYFFDPLLCRRWWSAGPGVACLSGSTAGCSRRCYSSSCRRRGPLSQTAIKLVAFAVLAMPPAKSIWKTGPFTGPRNQPCPGSHKPPLGPSSISVPCQTRIVSQPSASSSQISTPAAAATDKAEADLDWSPPDCAFIRHIPKAASSQQ